MRILCSFQVIVGTGVVDKNFLVDPDQVYFAFNEDFIV
jgi:hypothetical protein